MSEEPPSDPLARLGERIDRARAERVPVAKSGGGPGLQQGLAAAWRIGIELVTAVAVSVGLGWALDRWLGTRPWAMVTLFFLGIAAGMLNVYRALTGTGGAVGWRRAADRAARPAPPDDEDC
jgi:ATP synthase protein I